MIEKKQPKTIKSVSRKNDFKMKILKKWVLRVFVLMSLTDEISSSHFM